MRKPRFSLRALLACVLACSVLFAILFHVWDTSGRERCSANLKQIGVALFAYREVYGHFPPPFTVDASGKRMHSWRTLIFPFVDQTSLPPSSFFKLKEPWDSPFNLGLMKRAGRMHWYACPHQRRAKDDARTDYVMIVGPDAASPGSRTIVVAEIADSDILWTEPRDPTLEEMSFQLNDASKPSISSRHLRGAFVLFADGTVEFLDNSTTSEELRRMLSVSARDDQQRGG